MLPRVLKNFSLYVDGFGWAGRVDTLTPPNLAKLIEDHRAGGMDAARAIEMGMEKLTTSFVISDHDPQLIRLLANDDIPLTARGSVQRQGSTATEPVIINMRGMFSGIEFGQWAPGTKTQNTVNAELHYLRYRQNGEELCEIDVDNMIRRFGGVDVLARQRADIGI